MKKIFILLSVMILYHGHFNAQAPQNWNSADIFLAMKKLKVLGSVLYIAAHPDDENTRLIAYFSKEKLYRTGYLSMTRGDGGQNLIGDEQRVELGLMRTQELLAARRVDGGEQFFTRAFDFGFSKNPEETFQKWNKEKILSDVVWVIRNFRPDVIITRFPTTGEGGHGHHTASAILANEAFIAAADPNRFPEQLKYVETWQAKRILWNTFNFGGANTTASDQFHFDVGGYNPLLGKSYGEIAALSRSYHKSQGFGAASSRGEAMEYFKTTGGDAPASDLMDGVDISWNRIKGGEKAEALIDTLIAEYDFLHPERSVKRLVAIMKGLRELPDTYRYWRNKKIHEVRDLVEQCSGLFMEATTAEQYAVQTDSVKINFLVNNRLGANAQLQKISLLDEFDTTIVRDLGRNKNTGVSKTLYVSPNKPLTQPYWLKERMDDGSFNVSDQQKIGQADVDASYNAYFTIKIEGEDFGFVKPVKFKYTDPVKGEVYQPLCILPVAVFSDFNPTYFKKPGAFEFSFRANKNLHIPSPSLVSEIFNARSDTMPYLIGGFDLKKDQVVNDRIQDTLLSVKNYKLNFSPDYHVAGLILRSIKYDHIPSINYFKEALLTVKKLDVKTYNKKIGYIVGAGDKVPEALEQMGYEVTMLGEKDLAKTNLKQFDAIITGVRAYNTDEFLNTYYDKLMNYVNEGGNLIVQYNTSSNIGPVKAKISPYPFEISRNRVTDEDAVVTFTNPDHPVLNFPNKITQDDCKDWVQERSIYDASNWDKQHFETVLSMHDAGEPADEGSLIIAKYGKGYFTYTGLVFFRQLPAGVPGAYRLLANIIALNKKKAF